MEASYKRPASPSSSHTLGGTPSTSPPPRSDEINNLTDLGSTHRELDSTPGSHMTPPPPPEISLNARPTASADQPAPEASDSVPATRSSTAMRTMPAASLFSAMVAHPSSRAQASSLLGQEVVPLEVLRSMLDFAVEQDWAKVEGGKLLMHPILLDGVNPSTQPCEHEAPRSIGADVGGSRQGSESPRSGQSDSGDGQSESGDEAGTGPSNAPSGTQTDSVVEDSEDMDTDRQNGVSKQMLKDFVALQCSKPVRQVEWIPECNTAMCRGPDVLIAFERDPLAIPTFDPANPMGWMITALQDTNNASGWGILQQMIAHSSVEGGLIRTFVLHRLLAPEPQVLVDGIPGLQRSLLSTRGGMNRAPYISWLRYVWEKKDSSSLQRAVQTCYRVDLRAVVYYRRRAAAPGAFAGIEASPISVDV